jgi:hypothetical protein
MPSCGQDPGRNQYVAVAVTPRAVDHGQPETTAFFTSVAGDPSEYGGLGQAEALIGGRRIVGSQDIEAALANLGYLEVPAERLTELCAIGTEDAKRWAEENKVLDAQGYARDNWGMFAARHLVHKEGVAAPVARCNTIDWVAVDKVRHAQREESAACGLATFM